MPSERTGLDIGGRADSVLGAAPIIATMGVSRLTSTTVDALYKTIVVVDVSKVGAVNAGQLGDYLAMIGLAQIDDQAETGGFDTVLNLFTTGAEGLTDWDRAYLSGLYGQERSVASGNAQAGTIAGAMRRQ